MTQTGIDEAGRGPVLGPMVLGGLKIQTSEIPLLLTLGVADSKLFGSSAKGQEAREKLRDILVRDFETAVVTYSPAQVDKAVRETSLNKLEQRGAKAIIKKLPADQTILDGKNLFGPLETRKITALNKADLEHPVVAGASIIAKVARDQAMDKLTQSFAKDYGPIKGGGYPNGQTLKFVLWYHGQTGCLPTFYRSSYNWKALALALQDAT